MDNRRSILTATAFQRCHVFHSDGVRNTIAETPEQYDRLMAEGCWHELPQEPPPPPEPELPIEEKVPLIQSEMEGLGDQVDAQAQALSTVEDRISALESDSHPPFDFGPLIERLEALERSRQGASGVTGAFQDRLNSADEAIKATVASLDEISKAMPMILQRLEALEAKKSKQ
jgi:hypothetical protein